MYYPDNYWYHLLVVFCYNTCIPNFRVFFCFSHVTTCLRFTCIYLFSKKLRRVSVFGLKICSLEYSLYVLSNILSNLSIRVRESFYT